MESQGQKTSNNPKAMLSSILSKRQKLQEELRTIEKQVYELETSYLQESSNFGNVWKGYEGFLSSSKNTANLKRSRKFQHEDRLFSLSSVTSPAAEELGAGREEGRSDMGPGRPKGGGLTINGQGKPKKGRSGPRDGRKIRLSNDLDLDDDDDHDMGGMR
ncbi:chromatin modification-related protein MEAF6 isoform X1 [Cynara cardunculus var. scolymus]|uniref:Histone H4 acetyltransferase, NuA4 complex, Eaf6 n=1 Tax=Cynara cardunculus var. scolymus TaxID=59895 RepID=A0A118JUF5_CYNCS|nr:chromatin modification-related protein MEAF6 isoform X1 [Cynara cardunculus var. scolymus]KVH91447.1 Histone H4 acetyltransferase, NuA4 complex, Eaf6 [Cynara cardunculus var. scolymus]